MLPRWLIGLALFCGVLTAADPPAGELARVESLIQSLNAMKAKLAVMEAEVDLLLQGLNAQKGALQQKPAAYNALANLDGGGSTNIEPDKPPPKAGRCAALTSAGTRCTRTARLGGRYCSQHQTGREK